MPTLQVGRLVNSTVVLQGIFPLLCVVALWCCMSAARNSKLAESESERGPWMGEVMWTCIMVACGRSARVVPMMDLGQEGQSMDY